MILKIEDHIPKFWKSLVGCLLVLSSGYENVVLLSMTDFTQKQKVKHSFFTIYKILNDIQK